MPRSRLGLASLASLALVAVATSPALATQDHYREARIILAWPDADVIIVEITSFSPEAEGADLETTWSIQHPPGTQQATVTAPYSTRAKLSRPTTSTIPPDKLDALVAAARDAATKRLTAKKTLDALTTKLGLQRLTAAKTCPARAKITGGRILVTAKDAPPVDGGASSIDTSCGATKISIIGRPICFTHPNGQIVRLRTRHSCEGDHIDDQIVWFPTAPPP